jgi:hypothetical protein
MVVLERDDPDLASVGILVDERIANVLEGLHVIMAS